MVLKFQAGEFSPKIGKIDNFMADKAKEFATLKHLSQKRRTGEPYIAHPERVVEIIKKYKKSHKIEELLSAAWLHDTLEDTETTEEEIKKLFGPLVSSLVKDLTSDKDRIEEIGKKEYLRCKMLNLTGWGLVIKLADRLDNLSDKHIEDNHEFRKRYSEETEYLLEELEKKRKLSETQKKLVAAIKEKLGVLKKLQD